MCVLFDVYKCVFIRRNDLASMHFVGPLDSQSDIECSLQVARCMSLQLLVSQVRKLQLRILSYVCLLHRTMADCKIHLLPSVLYMCLKVEVDCYVLC